MKIVGIKLELWYLLNDRKKFWSDMRRKLHILTLERSQYYSECEDFYSKLNVEDKLVLDFGCDFGTSPMYFLNKGAKKVIGISMDKQYFRKNSSYTHYLIQDNPKIVETIVDKIDSIRDETGARMALKADCEGCEWKFTPKFIENFDDWIIALHTPILNKEVYEYIEKHGEKIGNQLSGKNSKVDCDIYAKHLFQFFVELKSRIS